MPNHLMIVMANSVPDLDDEFNRWYDEEHLEWVVDSIPGLVSGRRYVQAPTSRAPRHPLQYVVIYEIAEDRLDEAYARWAREPPQARPGRDGRDLAGPVSPAMDTAGSILGFFSPTGTVVDRT